MTESARARAARYRAAGWWPGEPLVECFRRHVEDRPNAHAVRDSRSAWVSRAELWARAGGLAEKMAGRGIASGDVVMICLPNHVGWQVSFLACLRLGAVPATLPVTSDAATLHYAGRLVGAQLLVVPQRHRSRDFATELLGDADMPASLLVLGGEGSETWRQAATEQRVPNTAIPGLCHLMFTSSTTGMPKAVAHTEDTLAAVNIAFAERFGIDGAEPIFMASPLGHSVGAWHGARLSLFTGAPLVLQEHWDPADALRLIAEERCGFTAAATPFLKDLVDAPWAEAEPKLASMRAFLCGGAPVPPALLSAAAVQMPRTFVTVLWGMTEGGVTTCLPGDPPERITGTAGRGLPGLELCTLSADGTRQPPGSPGELAMRGPGVFVGYYGQDELYREHLTSEGFFRTGDMAEVGTDGYIRLTARLKDLIIRGGVNISPIPLENALSAHPNIQRVSVIGTPDPRMGERICAVIVPQGEAPTLDGLLGWLSGTELSRRQWPEQLVVVDAMPETAAGKIRKAALRTEILEERT